jgi:phosphoribosylanthranilate isomerase
VLLDNGYGTGKCFDWSLLSDHGLKREFLLAGGLSPENAEEAVRAFHPWGIDVSSGVETDRKKDPEKIRQMIEKIRRL